MDVSDTRPCCTQPDPDVGADIDPGLSGSLFEAVVNALSAHIAILDENGLLLAVNNSWRRFAEQNRGSSESVGPGLNYLAVCHDAATNSPEAEAFVEGVRDVIEGSRDSFYMQYDCHAPTEERWFQVRVTPFHTQERRLIVIAHENITEQKRAEASARRAQAQMAHVLRLGMLNEMAAGMAHELNQPLSAIANYASGSLRGVQSGRIENETLGSALQDIARQAERAGEILRGMRNFGRRTDGERMPADVNRMVREAVSLHQADGDAGEIHITVDLREGLPQVFMDEVQIQQVVMNLIRNASEAMIGGEITDDSRVTVRTRLCDGGVSIEVEDNGPGIDAEHLERIFDPFFTTKPTGMGLGLSLSRSILHAHGSELFVHPNQPRGVTFRFTLPAQDDGVE